MEPHGIPWRPPTESYGAIELPRAGGILDTAGGLEELTSPRAPRHFYGALGATEARRLRRAPQASSRWCPLQCPRRRLVQCPLQCPLQCPSQCPFECAHLRFGLKMNKNNTKIQWAHLCFSSGHTNGHSNGHAYACQMGTLTFQMGTLTFQMGTVRFVLKTRLNSNGHTYASQMGTLTFQMGTAVSKWAQPFPTGHSP